MIKNDWTVSVTSLMATASDDSRALPVPQVKTSSGGAFFHHHDGAFRVLFGAIDSAIFADNAAFVARKVLEGSSPLPGGFDPYKMLADEPGPHLRRLASSPALIAQRASLHAQNEAYFGARDSLGPTVDLTVGALDDRAAVDQQSIFGTSELTRSHVTTYSGAIVATQLLYSGGRITGQINEAQANVLSAREGLRQAEGDTLLEVRLLSKL